METVTIKKIKKELEENHPKSNHKWIGFTVKDLVDNKGIQLYTGDIVEFSYGNVTGYRGVIMFGKYTCWGYGGVPDEFIGFYILPTLGTKEIPIDLSIHRQLVYGKVKYVGNIYEKEWEYLFEKQE